MGFKASKPRVANQGSAGKAPVQPVKKSGVPSGVKKPGADKLLFSKQPSGTRGKKAPKHASN
mgnify:FL=1